ncbi:MAG: hypothetical protein HN348_29910, partial [Proteobacteria bacterium]|nr:hypothetical protein [Pseudomonadota bacterium]
RESYLERAFPEVDYIVHPSSAEAVAVRIAEESEPEDMILVWGMESQLYALSHRLYATQAPWPHIIANEDYVEMEIAWWIKEQQQKFMIMLAAERPLFFIVVSNDANQLYPTPSDQMLDWVPGLSDYLKENYDSAFTEGQLNVYRRRQ